MTVESWTLTPIYTISGIGPYEIIHPYAEGAIYAVAIKDGLRRNLTSLDFSLTPVKSALKGNLFLTPAAAVTHAGSMLIINRQTPDEQGWLGVRGEREKGLETQLDRMVQADQEIRTALRGSVRLRSAIDPIDTWPEGTVLVRSGTSAVPGPNVGEIANAQDFSIQSKAFSVAAAASAAQAEAKQASMPRDRGVWANATSYAPSDFFNYQEEVYITQTAHIATTIAVDLSAGRIRKFIAKGTAGTGTGDMLNADNLAGLANKDTAWATLGGKALGKLDQVTFSVLDPAMVVSDTQKLAVSKFANALPTAKAVTDYVDGLVVARDPIASFVWSANVTAIPLLDLAGWDEVEIQGELIGSASVIAQVSPNNGVTTRIAGYASRASDARGILTNGMKTAFGDGGGVMRFRFSIKEMASPTKKTCYESNLFSAGDLNLYQANGAYDTAEVCNAIRILAGTISGGFVKVYGVRRASAALTPPVAAGTIGAQNFTQGVAITPINLGAYFIGAPATVLISPATPGLTVGVGPNFTLSGIPTAARGVTAMTVTAQSPVGNATQAFTTTILLPGVVGRAAVDGLRDRSTPNGRTSTNSLKRVETDSVPAGWTVTSNTVQIRTPFSGDIVDWEFGGRMLDIYTPINSLKQSRLIEPYGSGLQFNCRINVGGRIGLVEYNDVVGPGREGGAGAAFKQMNNGGGTIVQFGEMPIFRFNRMEGLSYDAIKIAGSYDAAGQIVEWNYFGAPANLPQFAPAAYSAVVSYSLGAFVQNLATGRRVCISKISGNVGNPLPTGAVGNSFWDVLDPHADAITTESAVTGITIQKNLFDWLRDPIGPLGPYFAQGLNNAIRLSRNTGATGKFDRVDVLENVIRYGYADSEQQSTPIQVDQGVGINFNGPISFTNNYIDNSFGGTYFHPSTNSWVNTWTNNRDAQTDAVIIGPTLRATGGTQPANTVAPAVTGTAATFNTLTCSTGTWTGSATIAFAYQWQVNGADILGATANTFYLEGGTAGASVQCIVTASNAFGVVAAASNIITGITDLAITVDSASLKLPDGNMSGTSSNAPGYIADTANWAPTGAEIFASSAGAFVIMVEIPWDQILMNSSQNMGLFGNCSTAGTNPLTMGINISRGATDQEAYNLTFRLRDGLGNSLVSVLPVTKAQKRLLCVFRYEAGAIQHEVYHQGTRIASGAPAMGTFVGTVLRSQLSYGAQGSGTTNAYFASSSSFGFIGSIEFFGYNNTGLTQADCQAMSLGVDPLTQVAATGWRMYRRLTGTDTASLTKQAACTNDVTSALTVFNARSLVFRRGSDLTPVRSGANWIDHDQVMDGFVFGRFNGEATGRVWLSGRASGLTGAIEARLFDEATGVVQKNWTVLVGSTIAAGVWAGYMDAPPNIQWGHIDIRPVSTPAMVTRIRARTGVGIVINSGPSQSQRARGFIYPTTGVAGATPGALAITDAPTFSATTYGLVSCVVSGERVYNGSIIAIANMLRTMTNEPIMLINGSKSGQGTFQLQNDAANTDGWNWTPEMEDLLLQASGPFARRCISVASLDWATAFANNVNVAGNGIIGNNLNPLFKGTFDVGAPTPYTLNHYLKDNLTFPIKTVYSINPIMRYDDTGAGPFDASGSGTNATTTGNHAKARAQWLTYAANEGFTVGPWGDDINMSGAGGLGSGGPHPDILTPEGQPRAMVRAVIGALWAMGIKRKTNPSLAGAVRSGGGTVFTIAAALPNGGTLQTAWAFKSIAVPTGETTVQGFEVQDGGVGLWSRSTFSTAVSSGSVVLNKKTGTWAANTKIRYMANGPLDYGTSLAASNLFNGALYEGGIEEAGLGIPLAGLWTATA